MSGIVLVFTAIQRPVCRVSTDISSWTLPLPCTSPAYFERFILYVMLFMLVLFQPCCPALIPLLECMNWNSYLGNSQYEKLRNSRCQP